MWMWRDWVIDAYNANMPFDQFTIEQIAGDMLPEATLQQKIASGFNRNHRINGEGGVIPEEYRVEYVIDRVSTTGHRLARPDAGLCAMPQSQVRPDLAGRSSINCFPISTTSRRTGGTVTRETPSR